MQKALTLAATAAATLLLLASSACQNSKQQAASSTVTPENVQEARIVYVQMDSVLNNYTQYKEMVARMEKKSNDSRASFNAKVNTLQRAGESFQQKLQTNQFATREAAEAEQKKLMNMQRDIEQLNAKLTEQLLKEQQAAEEELYKTIKQQIAKANETWGYEIILTNVKADNILFAQPELDITQKVIDYLNAAYTSQPETK